MRSRNVGTHALVPAVTRLEDARPARLRDGMRATRERLFVGRDAELALFRSAIGDGSCSVLHVHGPGGIGKSVLLKKFAVEAELAGRHVVELDAQSATPESVEAAAAHALADDRAVLLIDALEPDEALERWLWEQFLPRLAVGAVVVIAARRPPDVRWTSDPGWIDALRVITLGALTPDESRALLAARDVVATIDLLDFASGHPLALVLASHGASAVRTLLPHLVGEIPSATHRRALEVCSLVRLTTEALLRVVVGDEAAGMFDWLRELPFVDSEHTGVRPHDVLRTTVAADLRWRDPESYTAMRTTLIRHLLERVRDAPEPEVLNAVSDLLHLHVGRSSGQDDLREAPLAEHHHAAFLALAEATWEPESAASTARWLNHRPEAFRVIQSRRTGEVVAFSTWLRFTDPDPDPVVAQAWAHAHRTAEPRTGEHIAVSRFAVLPAAEHLRPQVVDLVHRRALAEILRSPRLAWTYLVLAPTDAPPPYPVVTGLTSGRHTLVAHDRRVHSDEAWLVAGDPTPPRPDLVVLPRSEFHSAVRDALRSAGTPAELAANPLNRVKAVARHGGRLRNVLDEVVANLAGLPRGAKYHQAVTATFLQGPRTQVLHSKILNVSGCSDVLLAW